MEIINNLAHLEQILSQFKDRENELNEKAKELTFNLDSQNWAWQRHFEVNTEKEPYLKDLPFPRLEMRLGFSETGYGALCIYGVVYRLYSESNDNSFCFIPISSTAQHSTTLHKTKDVVNTNSSWIKELMPFRDRFHILSEMKLFNMRAFFVIPSLQKVGEIEYDCNYLNENILSKMIQK